MVGHCHVEVPRTLVGVCQVVELHYELEMVRTDICTAGGNIRARNSQLRASSGVRGECEDGWPRVKLVDHGDLVHHGWTRCCSLTASVVT